MADNKYTTFVMGEENFTVRDLDNIQFTTSADLEKMEYKIKAKVGMKTPLGEVLELLQAGMNFTLIIDGEKYSLKLVKNG
jgi:ubiquinone biosynthesis protein COQ9